MKKYILMVSALFTISFYPMKRLRDIPKDQKIDFLAQKIRECKALLRIAQAQDMQESFFPDKEIESDEQANAQHHADDVVTILNSKYATHLSSVCLPDVMRNLDGIDGERVTRFVQHVMQESYCVVDSRDARSVKINKVLESIEEDSGLKYYILTGRATRSKRVVTESWQEAMRRAFNRAQEWQNKQQEMCLKPLGS